MVDALVALIAWLGLLSEAKDHRATTSARQVIPREHPHQTARATVNRMSPSVKTSSV